MLITRRESTCRLWLGVVCRQFWSTWSMKQPSQKVTPCELKAEQMSVSSRFAGDSRKTLVCVSKGTLSGVNLMIVGGVGLTTVDPTEEKLNGQTSGGNGTLWTLDTLVFTTRGQIFSTTVGPSVIKGVSACSTTHHRSYGGRMWLLVEGEVSLPGTRGPLVVVVVVGACWAAVVVSGGLSWSKEIIVFNNSGKSVVTAEWKTEMVSYQPICSCKGKRQRCVKTRTSQENSLVEMFDEQHFMTHPPWEGRWWSLLCFGGSSLSQQGRSDWRPLRRRRGFYCYFIALSWNLTCFQSLKELQLFAESLFWYVQAAEITLLET